MKKSKRLLLLLVCFFFNQLVTAQNSSNKGTEFWVGFMAHYSQNAGMYLYITSDSTTTGEVTIPGRNWSKSFTVTANSMTLVQIPSNQAYVDCSDCIKAQGIKVTAAKKIIVYSHIYYQYRSDATLVLPVQTTGKEYYCMSYDQGNTSHRSQFMIVAKEDSTRIKITPTTDIRSSSNGRLKAGQSYYILLDAGEVYQGRAFSGNSSDDVTGTHIEVIDTGVNAKCRTVSVFSGNSWTSLGCTSGFSSGDNLYEQMYPVNSWGSAFVTVPLRGVNSDNLRFLAAQDKTSVLVYSKTQGAKTFNLDAGEYDDLKNVDEAKYIIASGPICVAQYSKTQACSGGDSDPSMTIINPIEQTLKDITLYSSRYEDIDDHYINIVIPSAAASSFRLDGSPVTFTKLGVNPQYSYAREKVNQGNHRLTANQGFLATAYGFGRYESYGYAAGANVRDLTAKIELANSSLKDGINICLGDSAELKGSAEYTVSKYEWDFGDNTTDTLQNPNHLYKDTGTYIVRLYTYKSSFDGCSSYDSAFLTVTVTNVPTAKFVTTTACEKGNVTLIDSSYVGAPDKLANPNWKFSTGSEIYTSTATKYFDSAGKYFVRLIVRTENYCYDTLTDSLTINPLPVVDFMAEKSCQLESTNFVNLSTIKTGQIDSFIWDFGTGDSSIAFEPKYLFQDSGIHEVVLTAFSDSGCTSSIMDTVYKFQNVDIGFTFNDTCEDLAINFTNTTKTNGANITGAGWVTSLSDSSSNTNYSRTFDSAGTFSIYYWIEVDSFCRDSLVQTIEVYPVPDVKYLSNNVCTDDSTEFINQSSIKTGSVSVVSWDVDDGSTYTDESFKVKYPTPGSKDIELKVVSDKGCEAELNDKITIGEVDITDIDISNECLGVEQDAKAIYTLTNDSVAQTSWSYELSYIFNDTMPKIRFSNAGTVDVEVAILTKNGCKSDFIKTVTVYDNPVVQFDVDSVCDKEDFTISNLTSMPDNALSAKYTWYYGGTQVSSQINPTITSNYSNTQTIRLIASSEFNCKDTGDVNTEVYALPQVNFAVTDTCVGQISQFIDQSSLASGTLSSYVWRFPDATSANGVSVSKDLGSDGMYTVYHIVTSSYGCSDSASKTVGIHPLPMVDISIDEYIGCEPFSPEFTNNSTISSGVVQNYTWIWGDGSQSTGFDPGHIYPNQGSYQVRVRAVSDEGCTDSADLAGLVTVHTLPKADFTFTPEKPSILESEVSFIDQSTGGVTDWMWNFDDGFTSTEQNPTHDFQDTGTFDVSLVVSTQYGCSHETRKSFFLNPDLFIFIPDGFSPNGDLVNDGFGIAGVKAGIKNYEVSIYNRWGEQIYYSDNHNEEWDGTYQGKPVPPGSYLYDMRFTDYKETRWYFKNGEVLLMR